MPLFDKIIDEIQKKAVLTNPTRETYQDEQGNLRCTTCNKVSMKKISSPFFSTIRYVPCICDCDKANYISPEELAQREEIEKQRDLCFCGMERLKGCTFANDDMRNPALCNSMKKYVDNFPKYKETGQGLLLYGSVGTGKTYYAAAIANALIDQGYSVQATNFGRITNALQGQWGGRQSFIDKLTRNALLIIDDLGAERRTEYMQEIVYNVIDERYNSGLPFIITSNLSLDEIKNASEINLKRIYDRILEKCHPVKIEGVSRRILSIKNSYSEMHHELDLP